MFSFDSDFLRLQLRLKLYSVLKNRKILVKLKRPMFERPSIKILIFFEIFKIGIVRRQFIFNVKS